MARVGDRIENPATGETIVFLKTAEITNGESLVIELQVKPHGFVSAEHIHPTQEETFEVTRGTIRFSINGKQADAGVGQTVTIPPRTLHSWWNVTGEEVAARVTFRPALNFETLFETAFGLVNDGKTNKKGVPGLFQLAIFLSDYQDAIQMPLPLPIKLLFKVLTPLARLLGYRASYPRYTRANTHSLSSDSSKHLRKV